MVAGGALVFLVVIIVVVLQFTGVTLNGSKKFSPINDEEVRVSKDVTVEEDTTEVSEEERIIIEIRELYEQKCYIEAIDMIINLDMEIFTEKQVKSILYILEESIYCYIVDIKVQIHELAEQKNIDEALNLYIELSCFIERMESYELTVEYICITTEEMSELQIYLYDVYIEVYYDILYQIAITEDEAALAEKLEECKLHIDITYYEKLSARVYTAFVIYRVNEMISQQIANEEILIFIDRYIELTGYSAYCLELWDNLFAQYRDANRIASWDSKITHVSANQYILEDSSTRLLTESDISHLTRYELYVARFEIYARHGRGFADPALTSYFEGCSWYSFQASNIGFDEFSLTEIERANIILIYRYEVSCGYYHFETMTLDKIPDQPKQNTTNTQTPVTGNSSTQTTQIPSKGAMAFNAPWITLVEGEPGRVTEVILEIDVISDNEINLAFSVSGNREFYLVHATGKYNANSGRLEYIVDYCREPNLNEMIEVHPEYKGMVGSFSYKDRTKIIWYDSNGNVRGDFTIFLDGPGDF